LTQAPIRCANCGGLAGLISIGGRTFTLGSFIFPPGDPDPELLEHEFAHVKQYEILGNLFWAIYLRPNSICLAAPFNFQDCVHNINVLELLADPTK
jgi:hypothetical protein